MYLGGQLLAVQDGREGGAGRVLWVHQDPVTKSQRLTDRNGAMVSTVDLDPWGGETARSSNQSSQPRRYTTYERDSNGGDEAMFRRYESKWARFSQPDPYDGSYNLADPQSLNRYSYTENDPVNFTDPTGLEEKQCFDENGNPEKCPDEVIIIQVDEPFWARQADKEMERDFYARFVYNSQFSGIFNHSSGRFFRRLTDAEVTRVRTIIEKQVTGDCETFINSLISTAIGSQYSREQLLADFNKVASSGGIVFAYSPEGGGAGGAIAHGNAKIEIGTNVSDFTLGTNAIYAAAVALHELIHVAANKGDRSLSETVRDLGLSKAKFPTGGSYSKYWDDVLKSTCFQGY